MNYFLDLLKFLLDVVGELVHLEGGDNNGPLYSLDVKLIELQDVEEVVLYFPPSRLCELLVPGQLFLGLFFLLVNPLLVGCSILRIDYQFFRG